MIEKSVVLPLGLADAFALFTEEIGEWWPPERRHTNDAESEIFLEASGRFFERASDGREVELGRVREWQPPSRLLFDFYPGTDRDHPTEVEVRFEPERGSESTRVTVLHRATEASRDLFGERAPRYVQSWDLVLPALARHVAEHRRGL